MLRLFTRSTGLLTAILLVGHWAATPAHAQYVYPGPGYGGAPGPGYGPPGYPGSGYYPPPYGGYYPGGYWYGQAAVLDAYSNLGVSQEQARVVREQANQAKLDTKVKAIDVAAYERANK